MLDEPRCSLRRCKHFRGVAQPDETEKTERPVCDAYPNGIPPGIAWGRDAHLRSRGDDGGIVFELEEDH